MAGDAKNTVLDGRLYVRLSPGHEHTYHALLLGNRQARGHLAAQLLLYDTVAIPTIDCGIVPTLISWLGLSCFERALATRSVRFIRRPGLMAYIGNGLGISKLVVGSDSSTDVPWWGKAVHSDTETAIDLQLWHRCSFIPRGRRSPLLSALAAATVTLPDDNPTFMRHVVHESYSDIRSDGEWWTMAQQSARVSEPDLAELPGVGPDQARIFEPHVNDDPIDLILRVAETNEELEMALLAGGVDLLTSDLASRLLRSKLRRAGLTGAILGSFISLLELNRVPDIRPSVASGQTSFEEILKWRGKRRARQFRSWLANAGGHDARELERRFVASIPSKSLVSALPVRVLRFALTTAVAGLSLPIGLAAGAVDSLFVDRWLAGYNPKLFLDDLKKRLDQ